MKIAVLFGSFDPPHIGHYLICQQVKEQLGMDEVWFMPDYSHPFGKKMTPPKYRLNMARLYQNDGIKTSNFSIKRKKISYTYDLLKDLSFDYPKNIFYSIIGSDNLKYFRKWKNWKKLIKEKKLIVFPRDTHLKFLKNRVKKSMNLKSIPNNITVLDSEGLIVSNISSTHIRKRVKNNQPLRYLVSEKIIKYIDKKNLYQK